MKLKIHLLIALLAAFLTGCGEKPSDTAQPVTLLAEGKPAPAFTLKTLDGKTISLPDLKGKPVVLNFWASWCPPCRQEMPLLKATADKYQDRVRFIGINVQETEGSFKKALTEFALPYPNGRDEGLAISQSYAVMALPRTFIIDSNGVISYMHAGGIDEATLEAAIGKLLR